MPLVSPVLNSQFSVFSPELGFIRLFTRRQPRYRRNPEQAPSIRSGHVACVRHIQADDKTISGNRNREIDSVVIDHPPDLDLAALWLGIHQCVAVANKGQDAGEVGEIRALAASVARIKAHLTSPSRSAIFSALEKKKLEIAGKCGLKCVCDNKQNKPQKAISSE